MNLSVQPTRSQPLHGHAGRSVPPPGGESPLRLRRLAMLGGPLLISAVAVAGLVSTIGVNGRELQGMWARLDGRLAVLLTFLFALPQAARLLRLRWLLPASVGGCRVLSIVLVQQFFIALLPWKLGDLSLPMLLKREGVRVAESLALLALTRWLDVLAVVLLLSGSLVVFWPELPPAVQHCWPAVVLAACLACLLLASGLGLRQPAIQRQAARWAGQLRVRFGWDWPWLSRHLREGYRTLVAVPQRTLLAGALATVLIWIFSVAFNVVFCVGFAPQLQWRAAIVVVLLGPLINHLPVRGLAGIGTTEAIAVMLFSLAGLEPTEALALGLWGHLCHFTLIAVAGLFGWVLGWFVGRPWQALRPTHLAPAGTSGDI